MPTPTPDEIRANAAQIAATGVKSATAGDQTVSLMDPLDLIKSAAAKEASDALAGANPQGGARSGWGFLAPAQAILPGAQ